MNVITALIVGGLIGWGIEWLIDWLYWRRKNYQLADELTAAQTRIQTYETEEVSLRTRITELTGDTDGLKAQLAFLEASNAQNRATPPSTGSVERQNDDAFFTGNVDPTDIEEMAKFKSPLEYVVGIGPVYAERLKSIGLVTCLDLLREGATRKGRDKIVAKSTISSSLILEWVNHVDLYRIKGVNAELAHLLEVAEVDTVVELSKRNPTNLFEKMEKVNHEKSLARTMPTQTQVSDWVSQAKSLPRVVGY